MRGLTQDIEISVRAEVDSQALPASAERGCEDQPKESSALACPSVIGVICTGDLAVHRSTVKEALQRGLEQNPDAVWVCLEKKSDRMTHDVMISLGIDPVVLPLNDYWRVRGTAEDGTEVSFDGRRTWRDLEMGSLCDQLVIFHKAASKSHWRDRAAKGAPNLHVIDIGKSKKEYTK